jgi:beta-lactam-binding protein with PASTA domain
VLRPGGVLGVLWTQTSTGTSPSTSLGAFTYVRTGDAPVVPVTVAPVATSHPALCHVPDLVGRTPATAKRRIRAGGCRVGKATRRRHHHHHGRHVRHVISQHPAARTDRPAGTSVSIVVR